MKSCLSPCKWSSGDNLLHVIPLSPIWSRDLTIPFKSTMMVLGTEDVLWELHLLLGMHGEWRSFTITLNSRRFKTRLRIDAEALFVQEFSDDPLKNCSGRE